MTFPFLSSLLNMNFHSQNEANAKIDRKYFMHETVQPDGTLEWHIQQKKECSPPRHRKITFQSWWWGFGCDHDTYFARKLLRWGGNWKFWILIARWSAAVGCSLAKTRRALAKKTKLAYVENNSRTIGVMLISECSREIFKSAVSINSGSKRQQDCVVPFTWW